MTTEETNLRNSVKCEAITNLLIAIMFANILIALENFKKDNFAKLTLDIGILSSSYIFYVLYGYFNLFKYFHKDHYPAHILPRITASGESKLLFVTGLDLTLLTIAPYFIGQENQFWFYITFLCIGLVDFIWSRSFMYNIEQNDLNKDECTRLFDLFIVVVSLLAITFLYYRADINLTTLKLIITGLNLCFFINPVIQLITIWR